MFSCKYWKHSFVLILLLISGPLMAADITFPYVQNFDGATPGNPGTLPANWDNVGGESTNTACAGYAQITQCFEWAVRTGGTPSNNVGPAGDHTSGSGNYVYVEASDNQNLTVQLRSPLIDLSSATSPELSFWVHRFNNGVSHTLHIDLTDDLGVALESSLLVINSANENARRRQFQSRYSY